MSSGGVDQHQARGKTDCRPTTPTGGWHPPHTQTPGQPLSARALISEAPNWSQMSKPQPHFWDVDGCRAVVGELGRDERPRRLGVVRDVAAVRRPVGAAVRARRLDPAAGSGIAAIDVVAALLLGAPGGWAVIARRCPGRSPDAAAGAPGGQRRRSGAPSCVTAGPAVGVRSRRGRCGTGSPPSWPWAALRRRSAPTRPPKASPCQALPRDALPGPRQWRARG